MNWYLCYHLGIPDSCLVWKASRAPSWQLWIKPIHTMPSRLIFVTDICPLFILGCTFVPRSISQKETQRKSDCWILGLLPKNQKYKTCTILSCVCREFYAAYCNDNFAWLLWRFRPHLSRRPVHEGRLAEGLNNGWVYDNNVPFFILHHQDARVQQDADAPWW